MQIKSIQTSFDSEFASIVFPNKKSIILCGNKRKAEHLIYLLECTLMNDFTGYYGELDVKRGYNYYDLTGQTTVVFSNGAIRGKDKRVDKSGEIPKFHVVRYVDGSEIRSFYISKNMNESVFNKTLSKEDMVRLVINVNKVCGCDFCKLENDKIVFDERYLDNKNYKLIYLLICECFQTPEGYSRVILLPNIESMSSKQQVNLIETLDNFSGHELVLSSGNIEKSDLSSNSCVEFLTI